MLRDYQVLACKLIRESWKDSPVLALATGAGKTVVAADIIAGCVAKGGRALLVVHTREIVNQTARRFREYGLDVGVLMAGKSPGRSPVVCASVQTLIRRDFPEARVVIIDEAHRAIGDSYKRVIEHYRATGAVLIGLTATPVRLDGRGLGSVGFGKIIEPVRYHELFEAGHLLKPRLFAPSEINVGGLKKRMGEFIMPENAIVGDLVDHYQRITPGTKAVAFACSINHSAAIAAAFTRAGIPAGHLDGAHSTEARDACIRDLSEGRIRVLSNCSLFGEGWDLPALETCIMARPTDSIALYRQQAGRVMRPAPGKTKPTILDHVGNISRHGAPWDPIAWSLEGAEKSKSEHLPFRRCPKCFLMVPIALSACPECLYQFPEPEGRALPKNIDGKLEDVSEIDQIRNWYLGIVRQAWHQHYKLGYARNKYHEHYGNWPGHHLTSLEAEAYPCIDHEAEERTSKWGTRIVCKKCLRPGRVVAAGSPGRTGPSYRFGEVRTHDSGENPR